MVVYLNRGGGSPADLIYHYYAEIGLIFCSAFPNARC